MGVVNSSIDTHTTVCCCDYIADAANHVIEGTKNAILTVAKVRSRTDLLARVARLGVNTFSTIELITGKTATFLNLTTRLITTETMVGIFQTLDPISYFVRGSHHNDSIENIIGNAALLTGGVGGVMQLLDKVSLISLANIGSAIGSIPVLGTITTLGVSFAGAVSGTTALAFGCFGVNAAIKLMDPEKAIAEKCTSLYGEEVTDALGKNDVTRETLIHDQKIQSMWDLAWCVSEVALAVIMIAGTASVVGIIVVGALAAAIGIGAGYYRMQAAEYVENEVKKIHQKAT